MSINTKEDEFGKYLSNITSINRKVLRYLFDLELKENKNLKKETEYIKINPDPDNNYFFFQGKIDFRSLTKLLEKYNTKDKLYLLNNIKNDNDNNQKDQKQILKYYLKGSVELRNDIWHNNIDYNNPNKYYNIINNIKNAYEQFKNNPLLNKSDLFENCIKYLCISLEFFKSK